MNKKTEFIFADVAEHDIDMLMAEEFAASPDFLRIFTDEAGISAGKVVSVHISKMNLRLGESDLTVVIESGGERIGLLIEDKIDSIAMPYQAERYGLRGEAGVENGDYEKFFVFIVAPQKYLSYNKAAQKYPNRIRYESLVSYFEKQDGPRAAFKLRLLKQAIEKQKKSYQVQEDRAVTSFWKDYDLHKLFNYHDLDLHYDGEKKGSNARWPQFGTVIKGLYIIHKTPSGFVDLTFDRCADRMVEIEELLSEAIGNYASEGYAVRRTGKSAAVRLTVPKIDMHEPFDDQINEVDECLAAVEKMANMVKKLPAEEVKRLIAK